MDIVICSFKGNRHWLMSWPKFLSNQIFYLIIIRGSYGYLLNYIILRIIYLLSTFKLQSKIFILCMRESLAVPLTICYSK